jgi:hypothetical protein
MRYHLAQIFVPDTKFISSVKAWLDRKRHARLKSHRCSRFLHTLGKFMNA